jgi:hypothetical protein
LLTNIFTGGVRAAQLRAGLYWKHWPMGLPGLSAEVV